MNSVGIICEYNPFHNGHIYHLKKVQEMFPNYTIVLILSGYFTQRGDISILDKWSKTELALQYGVDIVVELPFIYATQSADIVAKGAIQLLTALKVNYLVFGSESNNITLLKQIADIQKNNPLYEQYLKEFLDKGYNYPTSISKSLEKLKIPSTSNPNDLLGISYLKEIQNQNSNITPICIKRTNQYHDQKLENTISSASSIRSALKQGISIQKQIPKACYQKLQKEFSFENKYYDILKYTILMDHHIDTYQDVENNLITRLKQNITCKTLNDFIVSIKMRRYTYNRIKRMLLHITTHLTQEEAKQPISYIRILGFSKTGKLFLHEKKKQISLPFITKYNKNRKELSIELRVAYLYSILMNNMQYAKQEYQNAPIQYTKIKIPTFSDISESKNKN